VSRLDQYTYEFVEFVPDDVEPGVLYVSTTYATAVHLCMCGCGHEVVTPITPHQWHMVFDGQSVSLVPSIGNWSFGCESHYWLEQGTVDWAPKWSRDRIEAGRAATRRRLEDATCETGDRTPALPSGPSFGWFRRLRAVLRR